MATVTETPPDTSVEIEFVAAPENVLLLNARIDDVKAEKVYNLAVTPGGVTNGKLYPDAKDPEYVKARRDLTKHVASRVNDGHSVRVEDYRTVGDTGIRFRVKVVPKSNRGRKAAS